MDNLSITKDTVALIFDIEYGATLLGYTMDQDILKRFIKQRDMEKYKIVIHDRDIISTKDFVVHRTDIATCVYDITMPLFNDINPHKLYEVAGDVIEMAYDIISFPTEYTNIYYEIEVDIGLWGYDVMKAKEMTEMFKFTDKEILITHAYLKMLDDSFQSVYTKFISDEPVGSTFRHEYNELCRVLDYYQRNIIKGGYKYD